MWAAGASRRQRTALPRTATTPARFARRPLAAGAPLERWFPNCKSTGARVAPEKGAAEEPPPRPRSALLSRRPSGRRPRPELARLLRSTRPTEQGLPEAVVAKMALGDE